MVSQRCKMRVEEELIQMGFKCTSIGLGVVVTTEDLTKYQKEILDSKLQLSGLELIENKRNILIERIKTVVTEMIHYTTALPKMNYSDYISEKLNYDYTYLSNIFSAEKGMTIQQFIILHKIERVKEMLGYGEFNLTQISLALHYSSVAHLSAQFKKTTGKSPRLYKQFIGNNRENLDLMEWHDPFSL
jgi:AraC-like DNA-binding protein